MDPEIKQKWLEALRSGKYLQGRGALCAKVEDQFKFCCLGVLCEVLDAPKERNYDDEPSTERYEYIFKDDYDGIAVIDLPSKILNRLGIAQRSQSTLIDMNDGVKPTIGSAYKSMPQDFKYIANWIEMNL